MKIRGVEFIKLKLKGKNCSTRKIFKNKSRVVLEKTQSTFFHKKSMKS